MELDQRPGSAGDTLGSWLQCSTTPIRWKPTENSLITCRKTRGSALPSLVSPVHIPSTGVVPNLAVEESEGNQSSITRTVDSGLRKCHVSGHLRKVSHKSHDVLSKGESDSDLEPLPRCVEDNVHPPCALLIDRHRERRIARYINHSCFDPPARRCREREGFGSCRL
jgi:hypothetical protein